MSTAALVEAVGGVVLAALLFFGGVYVGRMKPELAAEKATVRRDAQNARQEATDATRINEEARRLAAAALDPIAAPLVRVQYGPAPACVPRAAGAGPRASSAPLPAGDAPGPLPGPDIGRPLVQLGHDADVQIDQLLDYIDHVCRVKPP